MVDDIFVIIGTDSGLQLTMPCAAQRLSSASGGESESCLSGCGKRLKAELQVMISSDAAAATGLRCFDPPVPPPTGPRITAAGPARHDGANCI